MSKNYEYNRLRSQERDARQRMQAAFQKYADARDLCNAARSVMNSAWDERCVAEKDMQWAHDELRKQSRNYAKIWNDYGRIRDKNIPKIKLLGEESNREHYEMCNCFDRARFEYEQGDKSMAPFYSQEGQDHKDRRDRINAEISELAREITDAKSDAKQRAPKIDSAAFRQVKEIFEQAKNRHLLACAKFKRLKSERDEAHVAFAAIHEEHVRLSEELRGKFEEIRANSKRERDETLDRAGICDSERDTAKIVKKSNGTTQVYYGGLGGGDGFGHGHIALDQSGNKIYERDASATCKY